MSSVEQIAMLLRELQRSGELSLPMRRELIAGIQVDLGGGNRAAVFLDVLGIRCVRRTWSVWEAAFGKEDSRPLDLAETAVAHLLSGRTTSSVSKYELRALQTYLDGQFALGERYFPAVYAGFAAWAVVRDSLSGGRYSPQSDDSELEIPPDEWDAGFLASLAAAGGATWESVGDSGARFAFWEWYLASAVPEAFKVAADL